MKILFITKDFIIEPLGILYLMGALKKAGHRTDIVKADVENSEEKVKEFYPDIIAYSVCTGEHRYFSELNLKLKSKFNFISIFGGAHPTFFSDFIKEEGVDIICIGEGEQAIVKLANNLEQGKDFTKVPNLWIKHNGEITKNSVYPLIEDLDIISFPDRQLIYDKYSKAYNNPIKNFIGGRGCPYNCSYCFNHSLKEIYKGKGQYVRFRTVDNLLEEILEVKKNYPFKMVYFQDDIFASKIEWLEEFSEKYPKVINVPFHCHLRVNLINEKMVDLLKKANCSGVTFGIETGNDELRNEILGRNMSKEQIIKAARIIRQAALKLRIFNMVGLPKGSLKKDFETLSLNIACRPDLGWASIYQPYPKTKLGETCIEMGIYDGDVDKISESFFEKSAINIPDKNKIDNLQKFFALAVSFPFLLPLVKILIHLPPNNLFKKIYAFWKEKMNKKLYNI